jgi:hypothetical protein
MKLYKEAMTEVGCPLEESDLALINTLSRKPLTAEEVYTFAVQLCDNEVDRDFEQFDREALGVLAKLFVGKTGIFDHQWQASGQAARIYRTELVEDRSQPTVSGEPYTALKAYAYMVRTEGNADLIREIEGGIKKEVSVSCAVAETVCSICGAPLGDGEHCCHTKGHWYGEELCYGILKQPTDAYEWSFVAVPAQPRAGVVKGFHQAGATLKEYLSGAPELLRQVEQLEEESLLGRKYLASLRQEVVRLGGLTRTGVDKAMRQRMAERLDEEELLALKKGYEEQLNALYPPVTQLPGNKQSIPQREADTPFLI